MIRLLRRVPVPLSRTLASIAVLLWSLASLGQSAPTGAAAPPAAVPAARLARNVAVITIEGEIDENTAISVRRRLTLAQRAGADAIVFEIDSPGGEVGAVLTICSQIKSCRVNTVAWVHPTAFSGGAIIALACREIVTSDPGTLGDALPILRGPILFSQLPEHEQQKLLAPIMAELVDSARHNHYDEFLVQGFASRGVELWLVRNKETGERLFINRAEYDLLFGSQPGDGPSALVTAKTISEPLPTVESAETQNLINEWLRKIERAGGRRRNVPSTPMEPSKEAHYVPASPGLSPLGRDVAEGIDQRAFYSNHDTIASARPVLSSTDRGRWEFVERLSQKDAAPFVFKADQLTRFGLATATINSDEQLLAYFGAKNLIRLRPTWSEGLFAFLTNWFVRAVLVVIFLVGLFIEMTHPGVVAPGAIATAAFLALVLPPLIIDLSTWWTLAAMLSGIVLIALEIFVIPGFGVAGVMGLLLLFAGLVGTFVPAGAFFPDTPGHQSDLVYGVSTLLIALVTSGVIMFFFARHFRSLPVFNRLVLQDPIPSDDQAGDEMFAAMAPAAGSLRVGMTATAITPLRPAGRIQVGDRIIDAVADIGYIPAGAAVKITAVSDFRIGVEPA